MSVRALDHDEAAARLSEAMGMVNIPTALTVDETVALRVHARGRRVLELGSLLGYSTVHLAMVAESVLSIDPHEGYPEDDPRPTLDRFLENIRRMGVADKVTVGLDRFEMMLPFLRTGYFEMAFLDLTGHYEDTIRAMRAVEPLLTNTAILCVHDCGHPDWGGVERACAEFEAEHPNLGMTTCDRMAIFTGLWR